MLTTQPGFYYAPRYSRDGARIVWSKQSGSSLTGALNSGEQGIWWMPVAGGAAKRVAKDGYEPQFTAEGTRVSFQTGGGLSKKLQSVGLHGEEPRDVFTLKYVDYRVGQSGRAMGRVHRIVQRLRRADAEDRRARSNSLRTQRHCRSRRSRPMSVPTCTGRRTVAACTGWLATSTTRVS